MNPNVQILGEYTHIKFDVLDKSYQYLIEGTIGFVQGLEAFVDKTSLQFKEVVACRSMIYLKPDKNVRHEQAMWAHKGPFTFEQFLKIIQFNRGILNAEWYDHMVNSSHLTAL